MTGNTKEWYLCSIRTAPQQARRYALVDEDGNDSYVRDSMKEIAKIVLAHMDTAGKNALMVIRDSGLPWSIVRPRGAAIRRYCELRPSEKEELWQTLCAQERGRAGAT